MKILINATILSERNTGLGVYTYKVLEYCCPLFEKNGYNIEIVCRKEDFLPDNCKKYFRKVEFKNFFERNLLISKIYKENYDLIWSTTQHGATKTKNKQIITIHDVTPLLYPKGRLHQYIYYKFILPRVIKNSSKIITGSENTKKDILKYYKNVNNDKIRVLYESFFDENNDIKLDETCFANVSKRLNVEKGKYFCIVGIHYYYKNIHSIIETYRKYEDLRKYKVIIIGNKNNEYGNYLEKLAEKYNLSDSFIFTGFLSNDEKNNLMGNCIAMLYPTKYEGFGLPVLEAMNQSIPVVCSNVSSLPEVAGDAALYFNPDDINDIHTKLNEIVSNSDLRDKLIEKGKVNVKRFSWDTFATKMLDIIKSGL